MQIDKSFSFRKTISPWYDSDSACLIKALLMFMIILFGIDGVKVARQIDAYNDYVWVPGLLFTMSMSVFVINLIRLVKRYGRSSAM
jgi:hypothetical protein